MEKVYEFTREVKRWGVEAGDYYDEQRHLYGTARLLAEGVIREVGQETNTKPMENETKSTLADGFFFDRPKEGSPAWVKGKVSIQVEKAIGFLKENTDEKGYCRIDLLQSKDGSRLYFRLNDWKPTPKEGGYGDDSQGL